MTEDRTVREGNNLARHLNEQYPDTALFLARHAALRPEATAASIAGIADGVMSLRVSGPEPGLVAVPLPVEGPDGDGLRSRLVALVQQTRAGVPEDANEPLTSLEAMMAGPATGEARQPHGLHARMAARHSRRP